MDLRLTTKKVLLITSAILCEEEEQKISHQQVLLSLKSLKCLAIRRIRSKFSVVTQHLSDSEFRRGFRMTRSSFMLLLSRLNHHLVRDKYQTTRSSGGVVQPNVRLAITLRLLAGGSYHDQMICWGVGRS